MKKIITFAMVCIGALTLLSGCCKDKEACTKAKQEQTDHSHNSKEIIDNE